MFRVCHARGAWRRVLGNGTTDGGLAGLQVHGVVGMQRVADATLSPAQSRKAYLDKLTRTSKALERSTSYKCAPLPDLPDLPGS